jgi:CheY-like chemotaxis protein
MSGKTILVIEDNGLNMKLVRSLLKIGHYTLLEASDAETGIELLQHHKPDLILMDIQLPGIDGLTATRLIKSNPHLRDIPIVAFTSYAMEGDESLAMQAGCAGYIIKPLDTHTFLPSLERYLRGGSDPGGGQASALRKP